MPVSRPLLFLPFFSRFRRSFPYAYNAAPNLNPIFHITSRKSYSAAGQEAVRRTALGTKERRNIFIFSLLLSSSLSLLPTPLRTPAARSKTISEHIAPRFSRSALRARPTAMSSRLFDPRGRRNNAYTTTVAVFPLLVSLVFVLRRPCTVVARFSTRKKSLGRKRVCGANWRIRVSRKISGCLIH